MPKGRHSSLETHPQREQILDALARHMPPKLISSQYAVSTWVLYRWQQARRPENDREKRRAMRQLKGETLRHDPAEAGGDALVGTLRDLEVQKRRMLSVQNAALKLGDLQRAAYVSDVIARNARHAAAIAEVLRLRQRTPATTFRESAEYQKLRADLLKVPTPEAVEHTAAVLGTFEAQGTLPVPDEFEELY
jgi:hypothetical protein